MQYLKNKLQNLDLNRTLYYTALVLGAIFIASKGMPISYNLLFGAILGAGIAIIYKTTEKK